MTDQKGPQRVSISFTAEIPAGALESYRKAWPTLSPSSDDVSEWDFDTMMQLLVDNAAEEESGSFAIYRPDNFKIVDITNTVVEP